MYCCPRCASENTKAITGKKSLGPHMGLKQRHCMDCENRYWTIEAIFKVSKNENEIHQNIYEILTQHFVENVRNNKANWPQNTYVLREELTDTSNDS